MGIAGGDQAPRQNQQVHTLTGVGIRTMNGKLRWGLSFSLILAIPPHRIACELAVAKGRPPQAQASIHEFDTPFFTAVHSDDHGPRN